MLFGCVVRRLVMLVVTQGFLVRAPQLQAAGHTHTDTHTHIVCACCSLSKMLRNWVRLGRSCGWGVLYPLTAANG